MSSEARLKNDDPRVSRSNMFWMQRYVVLCLVIFLLGFSVNVASSGSLPSRDERLGAVHGIVATTARSEMAAPSGVLTQSLSLRGSDAGEVSSSSSLGETYLNQMDLSMNKLKDSDNQKRLNTMLVHTGRLSVSVEHEKITAFEKQLQFVVSETGGGYFQSKSHDSVGTNYQSMHMVIRVRSDKFDRVVEDIQAIAKSVNGLTTNTRDVTDEFVDASARADVLEAARASLQAVLSKSTDCARDTEFAKGAK